MMRVLQLALAAALLAMHPLAASWVPMPGHYKGGHMSFRLGANGEVSLLHYPGGFFLTHAGSVEGVHWRFSHALGAAKYHFVLKWKGAGYCEGEVRIVSPDEPEVTHVLREYLTEL